MIRIGSAITVAKNIIVGKERDDDLIFSLQRDKIKFIKENIHLYITDELAKKMAAVIDEHIGLKLKPNDVRDIFFFFPSERSYICGNNNDVTSTECVEMIMSAVSMYFVGCEWPTYGDNLEVPDIATIITEKILQQAVDMGFAQS